MAQHHVIAFIALLTLLTIPLLLQLKGVSANPSIEVVQGGEWYRKKKAVVLRADGAANWTGTATITYAPTGETYQIDISEQNTETVSINWWSEFDKGNGVYNVTVELTEPEETTIETWVGFDDQPPKVELFVCGYPEDESLRFEGRMPLPCPYDWNASLCCGFEEEGVAEKRQSGVVWERICVNVTADVYLGTDWWGNEQTEKQNITVLGCSENTFAPPHDFMQFCISVGVSQSSQGYVWGNVRGKTLRIYGYYEVRDAAGNWASATIFLPVISGEASDAPYFWVYVECLKLAADVCDKRGWTNTSQVLNRLYFTLKNQTTLDLAKGGFRLYYPPPDDWYVDAKAVGQGVASALLAFQKVAFNETVSNTTLATYWGQLVGAAISASHPCLYPLQSGFNHPRDVIVDVGGISYSLEFCGYRMWWREVNETAESVIAELEATLNEFAQNVTRSKEALGELINAGVEGRNIILSDVGGDQRTADEYVKKGLQRWMENLIPALVKVYVSIEEVQPPRPTGGWQGSALSLASPVLAIAIVLLLYEVLVGWITEIIPRRREGS